MGITIYSVQKEKAPVEVRPKSDETLQTKVSCQGDIAVQPFYPETSDGVAWLLLCQGPAGEPGRDINGEVDEGPRLLAEQPGVLIGAEDPRSLDVIIEALAALKDRLEGRAPKSMEEGANVDIVGQHIHEASKNIQDDAGRDLCRAFEEAQGAEEDEEPPTTRMERGGIPAAPERPSTPWGKVTQ